MRDKQRVCCFIEMSYSHDIDPRKRGAAAADDAIAKGQAKVQDAGKCALNESSEGNVGTFSIVTLYANILNPI